MIDIDINEMIYDILDKYYDEEKTRNCIIREYLGDCIMSDLISKSTLRKELSKLPSEMGYVRKSEVMQILNSQKIRL